MTRIYCDGDTFERGGRTFKVEFPYDDCMGAPWKEHDGHGPVSEWTHRDKRPGERVLNSDRDSSRFYDWQEAIKIAKRDGWGSHLFGWTGNRPLYYYHFLLRHWRKPTAGEIAEAAVSEDFERLHAWCNDEWTWVSVSVTEVESGEKAWLGGMESDDDEGLANEAHNLADEINERIGPAIKCVCPSCGSDDLTRDACTRWNVKKQEWELATVYDDATCGACGWEGHNYKEVEVAASDTAKAEIVKHPL